MGDRRSIRLPAYDYRHPGAYFVTVCTFERRCMFEDLPLRRVVERTWLSVVDETACLESGEFVVMPNHVHGIVWIRTPVGARHSASPYLPEAPSDLQNDIPGMANGPGASPLQRLAIPQAGSLGAVVGSFKSVSARRINRLYRTPGAPVWQRNYYERVIRDEREFAAIREYILDNPRKRADDPYNPANRG
jgi:REP element-mobilizing transposase RayT